MRHVPFAVLVCLFAAAGGCSVNTARVETTSWGIVDGDTVRRYTLRNEQGMEVGQDDPEGRRRQGLGSHRLPPGPPECHRRNAASRHDRPKPNRPLEHPR